MTNLYGYMPYIFGGVLIILGAFMYLFPEKSIKKEKRPFPKEVAKASKNGIIMLILSALMVVSAIIKDFLV